MNMQTIKVGDSIFIDDTEVKVLGIHGLPGNRRVRLGVEASQFVRVERGEIEEDDDVDASQN